MSHNFYFDQISADYFFKKLNLKIVKKNGFQEYDANHLLTFVNTLKRSTKVKKFFSKKQLNLIEKNIEDNLISTSLLYILRK